jgi:NADH dehydrogenase
MRIALYEASPGILSVMSGTASTQALRYLTNLGVEVHLNTRVIDFDNSCLKLSDGSTISSKTVIWSAGIMANGVKGLNRSVYGRVGRIMVDRINKIKGYEDIFAIGDNCLMETPKYPSGHPQIAQTVLQQAKLLGENLIRLTNGRETKNFEYIDKGSLATIGRNLAVADLPFVKLKGFVAWVLWSFVHLFTIMGVKNRIFIFLNWSWNYFTYDQSLRLLIKPKTAVKQSGNIDKDLIHLKNDINADIIQSDTLINNFSSN